MQLPGRLSKYNARVKNMIPIFLKKAQITIPSFLAIFVVFVVAVFFSGIIILACSQIPESTFSPVSIPPKSQDPIANWQTYHNEEYGFGFKYPKDWKVENNCHDFKNEICIMPENDNFQMFIFSISIIENLDKMSSKQYAMNYINDMKKLVEIGEAPSWAIPDYEKEFETSIAGENAYELYKVYPHSGDETFHENIYLSYNKYIYNIYLTLEYAYENPNSYNIKNFNKIAHQILSTFKFIN